MISTRSVWIVISMWWITTTIDIVQSFVPSLVPSRNHIPQWKSSFTSGTTISTTVARRAEEGTTLPETRLLEVDPQVQSLNQALGLPEVGDDQVEFDTQYMKMTLHVATSEDASPFPKPLVGAVLVTDDGKILGQGRSNYKTDAVQAVFIDAGLDVTPLSEWCVTWPSSEQLRKDLAGATLYVTLEPSPERMGTAMPPLTQLIQQVGIARVVIGCADPVASRSTKGATALHESGMAVSLGVACAEECQSLIASYAALANSKLHRMARQHYRLFQKPLGFLHCSVVDSMDIKAFQRNGNAFGTDFGGKLLSFRNFGSYEIAPPPEVIWADTVNDDDLDDMDVDIFNVDFDDERFNADSLPVGSPMMPWYEQVDAVAATFPRAGNGPPGDQSVLARLNGLKWLATHGEKLPAGVERILVMDATDLQDLPLTNNDPNLPKGVDVEAFWRGHNRKPTRVLLRRGANEQARAAAAAAAKAAHAAAQAAKAAAEAIEMGDAAQAAEVALELQKSAKAEAEFVQAELQKTQRLKSALLQYGVLVETLEGGEPIDVMKHLGKRHGYKTVVWRAGCWGDRGVRAILAGAFQWVSAHLAVDANGGRFWQLMVAENAVQAACGPSSKVKVFADQEDISLEYCDEPSADSDCAMTVDGRPIRHIRLDCRIALYDDKRSREFRHTKTTKMDRKVIEEQAPWFI